MLSIPSLFTPSSPFPSKLLSSDDAGALGGTTEVAGGTNDDVAGGGGEDCVGWWCRALTAAQSRPVGAMVASLRPLGARAPQYGEFFYVMNSEIGWFRRYFLRRLARLLQKRSSFVC